MHGNRDFLIREGFAMASGAMLLQDPTVIDLYGEKVLLLHGDSLCTKDVGYMNFRKNMRNPEWQRLFLIRPLQDRKTTAQQLRAISMAKNKGKKEEIMDVTPEEVLKIMNEHQVKKMIHGHTHRPSRHNIQLLNGADGERVVLGDWDKSIWYLEVHENSDWQLLSKRLT
jgi:UDP-2,3-diacylglucosamine hydrolase